MFAESTYCSSLVASWMPVGCFRQETGHCSHRWGPGAARPKRPSCRTAQAVQWARRKQTRVPTAGALQHRHSQFLSGTAPFPPTTRKRCDTCQCLARGWLSSSAVRGPQPSGAHQAGRAGGGSLAAARTAPRDVSRAPAASRYGTALPVCARHGPPLPPGLKMAPRSSACLPIPTLGHPSCLPAASRVSRAGAAAMHRCRAWNNMSANRLTGTNQSLAPPGRSGAKCGLRAARSHASSPRLAYCLVSPGHYPLRPRPREHYTSSEQQDGSGSTMSHSHRCRACPCSAS